MYKPEYLNRWKRPSNYAGANWYDHFGSGCGQHRDSDVLERANFRAMLNALGFDANKDPSDDCPTIADEPTRLIVLENHWAVGWVEWIAIHDSDTKGLKIADDCQRALTDYPILDGELFSELENEECSETWLNCYVPRERLKYIRENVSREWCKFRDVREACRGSWYHAACMLPCPSDLLH